MELAWMHGIINKVAKLDSTIKPTLQKKKIALRSISHGQCNKGKNWEWK
jgi:hypothetical protein